MLNLKFIGDSIHMKKFFLLLLLCFCLLTILIGCSKPIYNAKTKTQSPVDIVNQYIESLKTEMFADSLNYITLPLKYNEDAFLNKENFILYLSKCSFTVNASQLDGEIATVQVDISRPNTKSIQEDYIDLYFARLFCNKLQRKSVTPFAVVLS